MMAAGFNRRWVLQYLLQACLLVVLLVPLFRGVFLNAEVTFPANMIYLQPSYRNAVPADLEPQNPLYSEIPIQSNVWYLLTTQSVKKGDWPLWNPFQFSGTPLMAGLQTAIFYPPRLVFLILEHYTALTVFVLFKLWLAGMVSYFVGRRLDFTISASRFLSLGHMLGGYMVTWSYFPASDSLAWLPLLFLGLELLARKRYLSGFGYAYVSAVLMFFAGGAQHLTTGLLLGIYFLIRLVGMRSVGDALRAGGLAISAGVAAIATCAVQLLPFFEFLDQSVSILETLFYSNPQTWHYPPSGLFALWTPRLFGTFYNGNFWGALNPAYLMMMYAGVPVWVGFSLLLARPRLARGWWCVAGLGVALLLGLLLALHVPWMSWLYEIPPFDSVRPAYFVSLAAFALPFVASAALDALSRQKTLSFSVLAAPAVLAALVVAASAFYLHQQQSILRMYEVIQSREGTLFSLKGLELWNVLPVATAPVGAFSQSELTRTALLFLLSIGALALLSVRRVPRPVAMSLLTLILAVDLIAASYNLLPTSPREDVYPRNEFIAHLQEYPHPHRINFNDLGVAGYPTAFGLEECSGYDALTPARFWRTLPPLVERPELFDMLFAAPTIVAAKDESGEWNLPETAAIDTVLDNVAVADNTIALPRARLVGAVKSFGSTDEMLEYMATPDFDPARLAVTDVPVEVNLPEAETSVAGAATITQWGWNEVTVEVEADKDSVLVLADCYYPGWKAYRDGAQVEVFPVYHLFRGVAMPEGKHTVRFSYEPLSFRLGLIVSTLTLLLMSGVGIVALRKRKTVDAA